MSEIDYKSLLQEILDVISEKVGDGFSSIETIATKHAKRVATQATLLTQSRISGQAQNDDEVFDFLKGMLQDMIHSMAKVLVALTVLTIETVWNSVVDVVWGAINAALNGAGVGNLLPPGIPEM